MTLPTPNEATVDVNVGRDGSYRVWHDPWDDEVDVTITSALATIESVDEAAVSSALVDHVDPDSLNRLFRPQDSGPLDDDRDRVIIDVEGHELTIHADGLIEIEP